MNATFFNNSPNSSSTLLSHSNAFYTFCIHVTLTTFKISLQIFFPTSCTLCQSCVRKVFWKSSFYFFIHNTNDAKEVRMKNLMYNAKKELILFPQKTFKLGFHHFAIKMRYFNVLMYVWVREYRGEMHIIYLCKWQKLFLILERHYAKAIEIFRDFECTSASRHKAWAFSSFFFFFFVIYFFESRRGQKIFWSEYFFYATFR